MWHLILLASITFPRSGDVLIASEFRFKTEALCLDHKSKIDGLEDQMLKTIFGKDVKYSSARMVCKEVPGEPI